jgi:hypothetical protein
MYIKFYFVYKASIDQFRLFPGRRNAPSDSRVVGDHELPEARSRGAGKYLPGFDEKLAAFPLIDSNSRAIGLSMLRSRGVALLAEEHGGKRDGRRGHPDPARSRRARHRWQLP